MILLAEFYFNGGFTAERVATEFYYSQPSDEDGVLEYAGRITGKPSLREVLGCVEWGRKSGVVLGDITITNADLGVSHWVDYDFRDCSCILRVVDNGASLASSSQVQRCIIDDVQRDGQNLVVKLKGTETLLEVPIQKVLYDSVTAAENTEMIGNPLPIIIGRARQVEPTLTSTQDLSYQVADVLVGVDEVYSGGSIANNPTESPNDYTVTDTSFVMEVTPSARITCDASARNVPTIDIASNFYLDAEWSGEDLVNWTIDGGAGAGATYTPPAFTDAGGDVGSGYSSPFYTDAGGDLAPPEEGTSHERVVDVGIRLFGSDSVEIISAVEGDFDSDIADWDVVTDTSGGGSASASWSSGTALLEVDSAGAAVPWPYVEFSFPTTLAAGETYSYSLTINITISQIHKGLVQVQFRPDSLNPGDYRQLLIASESANETLSGTFTAPVAGKFFIRVAASDGENASAVVDNVRLGTSAGSYPRLTASTASSGWHIVIGEIADRQAGGITVDFGYSESRSFEREGRFYCVGKVGTGNSIVVSALADSDVTVRFIHIYNLAPSNTEYDFDYNVIANILLRAGLRLTGGAEADAQVSAVSGYRLGLEIDEDETVAAALQKALDSISGYYYTDSNGTMKFGRYEPPTGSPVVTLSRLNMTRLPMRVTDSAPGLSTKVAGARNWSPYSENELAGITFQNRPPYMAEFRHIKEGATAKSINRIYSHALSAEPIRTVLCDEADVQAEANRICLIAQDKRPFWDIEFALGAASDIAAIRRDAIVLLDDELFENDNGKIAKIVEVEGEFGSNVMRIVTWGAETP